jgi:hypothetical protein
LRTTQVSTELSATFRTGITRTYSTFVRDTRLHHDGHMMETAGAQRPFSPGFRCRCDAAQHHLVPPSAPASSSRAAAYKSAPKAQLL